MKLLKPFLILFFFSIATSQLYSQEKMDHFAKIGNMVSATRLHLLEEKVPKPLPEQYLPVTHNSSARFKPIHSMNTNEELQAELVKYRKQSLIKGLKNQVSPIIGKLIQILVLWI